MSNEPDNFIVVGLLIGVVLLGVGSFWSGLATNPDYKTGAFVNYSSNPKFQTIKAATVNATLISDGIKNTFSNAAALNIPGLAFSVLSLIAGLMFALMISLLSVPFILIDIVGSSIGILSPIVDLTIITGAILSIILVKGIFGVLKLIGAVNR